MGTGGLAYEGVKAVPALLQRNTTEAGQALSQLDAQILAENIRLGNISVGTMAQGALDIGHTLVKPVMDPWNQGQYVESLTRGIAEVLTLGGGMIAKGGKAAEAAKAANTAQTVAKSAQMADVADAGKIGAAADATASGKAAEGITAGDGVYVGASATNSVGVVETEAVQVGKYARRTDIGYRPATDVNATFPEGYSPPYKPGTRVTEFTNAADDVYVRVHGEDSMARSWMRRPPETEEQVVYEFSDEVAGAGQLQLDKASGDVKEITPAPRDETGRRFQRAAMKIAQHWQSGELPSEISWDS